MVTKNHDEQWKPLNESWIPINGELFNEMGININHDTHEVEFTDAHENGVDTSLENNPTIDNETIPRVTIYSIFQRNDTIPQDGNPLIYALKGNNEHKWSISDENKSKLKDRIKNIVDKFCEIHSVNFTIVVPSGGNINSMLRDMVNEILTSHNKENIIFNDVLDKMTADEVQEALFEKDSPFTKEFDTPEKQQRAWEKMKDSFARMNKENDGVFSYKMVQPPRYRKWITKALKFSSNVNLSAMASKLPGKHILIIDDTVTFGNTIRSVANLIRDTISNIKGDANTVEQFAPASISALTLFSVKHQTTRIGI
jgi:hypothetical protein